MTVSVASQISSSTSAFSHSVQFIRSEISLELTLIIQANADACYYMFILLISSRGMP